MRRFAHLFGLVSSLTVLCALAGCANSQNRQEITGEVRLNGVPIEDGVIQFEPLDGQPSGDGAQIIKGAYKIPADKGLAPGRYKIMIVAGNSMDGAGDASPDSPHAGKKQWREKVPPEYNEKSNVVREVTSGTNRFDFDIK
jgi:hypothetical protein